MTTALIIGVSGQDGAYLARLLAARGVTVAGTSRAAGVPARLEALGIADSVALHLADPALAGSLHPVFEQVQPDQVYYLSAQSSVAASFADPAATRASIVDGLANALAARRDVSPRASLVNAASGDCFGETGAEAPASETSLFAPRSPYAEAKCAAHEMLAAERERSGALLTSAFMFSHESRLRDERFAIGKIATAVSRIAAGTGEQLELGNIAMVRDWGWAPEYVDALAAMAGASAARDYIVATGRSYPLERFVAEAFALVGRDWREHVTVAPSNPRPNDIREQHADPTAIARDLGWKADTALIELPAMLIDRKGKPA